MGNTTSGFNPATDLLDLQGKVAIVTGGKYVRCFTFSVKTAVNQ
jgi:hypothetical protein